MQDKVKTKPLDLGTHFEVTKYIRLVPPFHEKEVGKYFLHFEKVAENLKWPNEHWTNLKWPKEPDLSEPPSVIP